MTSFQPFVKLGSDLRGRFMNKIIIGVISLMFAFTVSAESRIEKQETKKFPTMKQCINWLDSKFPNKQWHNGKGMP
jgi:hypothetical protein